MKKLFYLIVLTLLVENGFSQKLNKVTISNNGKNVVITMLLDQNVVLNISQDGTIVDWGVDKYVDRRADYYERSLEKFEGRVENYKDNDNEAYKGKIKFIGGVQIKYFDSYEDEYELDIKMVLRMQPQISKTELEAAISLFEKEQDE